LPEEESEMTAERAFAPDAPPVAARCREMAGAHAEAAPGTGPGPGQEIRRLRLPGLAVDADRGGPAAERAEPRRDRMGGLVRAAA
jgi:hypothetical protein